MPGLPIDPDDELVDVSKLFPDANNARIAPQPIVPGGESYEMEDMEQEEPVSWSRAPISAPKRPAKPIAEPESPARFEPKPEPEVRRPSRPAKPSTKDDDDDDEESDDEASVDEVWTRWGEWGPTIIQLAAGFAGVIFLTYLLGSWLGFVVGFLVFFFGMAGLIPLLYPIAVTLERPVRMTPEQALKDFYGSAEHHFPQFRRMWLLLSSDGRQSIEFDSYATFRSYWKHQLTKIRGSSVKASTPLVFSIEEFDADKSAGKTMIDASYVLTIRPRGDDGRKLTEIRIKTSLVKGPDKMWYLNRGTL